MKVEVHLFANLSVYRPGGTVGDAVTLELPRGTMVRDVIQILQIPPDLECMRIVNGHDAAPDQPLVEGDVLSLFPPLAGG